MAIQLVQGTAKTNRSKSVKPYAIFIPTLTAGGAERVASILANQWSKKHPVIVFTYFDEPQFYKLNPQVKINCLGFRVDRAAFKRTINVIHALIRFRRLLFQVRPRFVLSFMNKYNAFCLAALTGTGIPVIVSERGSPTEKLPRLRVFARDSLYPRAAGVICQTNAGHHFIHSCCRLQRSTVIPNPVVALIDVKTRQPQQTILNVSRFVHGKAHDHLLRAFAQMAVKGWRLVLCGDGPCRDALEQQARALGIADRIEFAGLVQDLRPYFRRAGMFAFSSLHEGYPNALAEAMLAGLPCVSYDCPTGPSDLIVSEQNGLLVPVGDVSALSAAMDRLAADPLLAARLGSAAANLANDLLPERIARQYLRFCLDAAAGSTL